MSDIRAKIADDIKEYHELCEYFKVEPKSNLDYKHFAKLQKKLQKRRDKKKKNSTIS